MQERNKQTNKNHARQYRHTPSVEEESVFLETKNKIQVDRNEHNTHTNTKTIQNLPKKKWKQNKNQNSRAEYVLNSSLFSTVIYFLL